MTSKHLLLLIACFSPAAVAGTTEFCLDGEWDLGARFQGTRPAAGEWVPTTWCVVTEDNSGRVFFGAEGKANPDYEDSFAVAYPTPDLVRIVNRDAPLDVEFRGADAASGAARIRRLDPRRLLEELRGAGNDIPGLTVSVDGDRVRRVTTSADLPLRGRVPVTWDWDWGRDDRPIATLEVDGTRLFVATGRWRSLPDVQIASLWQPTPGAAPIEVPGDAWPTRIDMQLVELADDVYVVRGVRTGFQHLVVDTADGLVVADAPAGWVEFHHLPPADFVPGLGISGLSRGFVEFLAQTFPGRPIVAVALTHFHDDHAGGARAFAAAGAKIYAGSPSAPFLAHALNRGAMPVDRLKAMQKRADVVPVVEPIDVGRAGNVVRLVPMGASPHVFDMLGVWAVDRGLFFVSDVHVPRSDADVPRAQRAETECAFAAWAVENLPADVRVVNSHSTELTPVSRLAKYLESDLCHG